MQIAATPPRLRLRAVFSFILKKSKTTASSFAGILVVVLVGCTLLAAPAVQAQTEKLVIGTREVPPFVIRNEDGSLSGIAIDLWRDIASELGLAYEFRETDLAGMLDGLQDGSLDAVVAALTVTPEREVIVDFLHPFHTSGLGIAVARDPAAWAIIRSVLSLQFFQVLAGLVLVLFLVGVLIWMLERRANPEQFGGTKREGIGSGVWWSAVTMTTVGYGDKAPVTPAGRGLAIVWMFVSVVTISSFTGAIASVFTVQQLGSQIQGPNDLPGRTVGTVGSSTSAEYLARHFISAIRFADIDQALDGVAEGQLDAAVYDAPVLRYLVVSQPQSRLSVLPGAFERQDYAIALRSGSPLREELNRALLHRITQPEWQDTLFRYLGD
jgi:ABC-type amino acid transport substrate-binding protein